MSTETQKAASAKWYAEHKELISARKKAWYIANKAQVVEVKKVWYAANKEKSKARSKAYATSNPSRIKGYKVAWFIKNSTYTSQYNRKRKEIKAGRERPAVCEACGRGGQICFDHCHITGKFRGWLCHKCNCILGLASDKSEILISLAKYLKHQRKVDSLAKRTVKTTKVLKEKAA